MFALRHVGRVQAQTYIHAGQNISHSVYTLLVVGIGPRLLNVSSKQSMPLKIIFRSGLFLSIVQNVKERTRLQDFNFSYMT